MTIPQPEIDLLKRTADLPALIRARGIRLTPRGKDLVGLCPFHADSTPSLTVTPAKNLWHCFSCGAGGDVIEFVRRIDGVDFPEAVRRVREFAGMATEVAAEGGTRAAADEHPNANDNFSPSAAAFFDSVLSHYTRTLKNDPAALRYLESRGLVAPELLERFAIGHADGSLLRIMATGQTKEAASTKALLRRLGVLRETGREHLTGCIVFPLFTYDGVPVSLYGRRIMSKGAVRHMYLPGPRRGLFHPEAFKQKELVLCESIIDALTFIAHGIHNTTCTYGTEVFTDEMLDAMKRGGVKKVLIAYDADRAGNDAAMRLAKRLAAEGIETRRVKFPLGTDANEYAAVIDDPSRALRDLILDAAPVEPEDAMGDAPPHPPAHAIETPSKQVRAPSGTGAAGAHAAASPSAAKAAENTARGIRTETVADGTTVFPGARSHEEIDGDEVRITYAERVYRVRGLFKNTSDHVIRINLRAQRGDAHHIDTFDLLSARPRQNFTELAAEELHVAPDLIKHDLGRLLERLEVLQSERIRKNLKAVKEEVELPPDRLGAAMAYLRDPKLLANIVRDFEQAGLVGERLNVLLGYLSTISRRTEAPLAIIIQSSSSAGKSALMEALLAFVPEEDRIKFSMMTGQSLYYFQGRNLRFKIIAISEEEGMERAKYAIKILQSEGRVTIATTVKDATTGLPTTEEFTVEGPVMFLLTTTNVEIDEELQNRALILMINESREQTARIQKSQRHKRSLDGIRRKRSTSALEQLQQDVQRSIRPLYVANNFWDRIDFPDTRLRLRRDQEKFLTLIETIALLHQHQRPIKTARDEHGEFEYIEVTEADIALAAHLAAPVFGISLDDLAPQTRRLLELIDEFVTSECERLGLDRRQFRFTRRQLREFTGWGDVRIRKHLARLEEMEYLLVHGGGRGQFIEYELFYEGQGKNGGHFIPGIPESFSAAIDPELLGFLNENAPFFGGVAPQNGHIAPSKHPQSTPIAPPTSGRLKREIRSRTTRSERDQTSHNARDAKKGTWRQK